MKVLEPILSSITLPGEVREHSEGTIADRSEVALTMFTKVQLSEPKVPDVHAGG